MTSDADLYSAIRVIEITRYSNITRAAMAYIITGNTIYQLFYWMIKTIFNLYQSYSAI